MSTVANLLDSIKAAHGMETDAALCVALGVKKQTLSNWRNGHNLPDAVACATIAGLTGLPLARVIGIVGEARAISREEKAVWRKLASAVVIVLALGATALPERGYAAIYSDAGIRHYAKLLKGTGVRVRHPNRQRLPRYPVTACRFREARLQVGLGIEACANLLRVSERSIRGWESGETRIPYAAYKLLRVLKGGRYLAHPIWKDFIVQGDVLVTPEGHRFQAGELGWWSLLIRQARAFRDVMLERRASAASAGLVSSTTSRMLSPAESTESPEKQEFPASKAGLKLVGKAPANDDSLTTDPTLFPAPLGGKGPRSNTGQKGHEALAGGGL